MRSSSVAWATISWIVSAEMRRQQHQILEALADRLGLRVLDGFCREPFGLPGHLAFDQELVTATGCLLVIAGLDLGAGACRCRRVAVAEAEQLFDERAFAGGEVLPLVFESCGRRCEENARRLLNRRRHAAQELHFLFQRHGPRDRSRTASASTRRTSPPARGGHRTSWRSRWL